MDIDDLIKFAEQGNAQAQNDLGICYAIGDGIAVDPVKAAEYFKLAYQQGEQMAAMNLARCFAQGFGVEQNLYIAFLVCSEAIESGMEKAITFRRDIAIEMFPKMTCDAHQGNKIAQYLLGLCYCEGIAVDTDSEQAIFWYTKAAEQGDAGALNQLGIFYCTGNGVQKNLHKGLELFVKAIQNGYPAHNNLSQVRELIAFEKKERRPCFLVKILDKQWADKLLDGEIFMKTLSSFGDLLHRDESSNNSFRGDTLEGITGSFSDGSNHHFFVESGIASRPVPGTGAIDMLIANEKVYCLYALEYDETMQQFVKPDPRIEQFGDTAVIIFDTGEFLKRIRSCLYSRYENSVWYSYKRVRYHVDLTEQRFYNEFSKGKSYSWQNEFRVAIDLSDGKFTQKILDDTTDYAKLTLPGKIELDTRKDSIADSITLNIGDIRDISIAVPTKKIVNFESLERIESKFIPPSKIIPLDPPREPRATFYRPVVQLPIGNMHQ